jgi:thioredoxin 1
MLEFLQNKDPLFWIAIAMILFNILKRFRGDTGEKDTDHGNCILVKDRAHFDSLLDEAKSKPVIVDFFATWCPPCKLAAPVFAKWSKQYPNVCFLKVDVDKAKDVAKHCQITAMPTFSMYLNKKNVDTKQGWQEESIRSMLLKHIKES